MRRGPNQTLWIATADWVFDGQQCKSNHGNPGRPLKDRAAPNVLQETDELQQLQQPQEQAIQHQGPAEVNHQLLQHAKDQAPEPANPYDDDLFWTAQMEDARWHDWAQHLEDLGQWTD
jgi:hypothetical protein